MSKKARYDWMLAGDADVVICFKLWFQRSHSSHYIVFCGNVRHFLVFVMNKMVIVEL